MRANSDEEKGSVASRPGMLVRADGLALPVVTAPDGVLVVPGLGDTGNLAVVLAPTADSGEP